jgi:hypothetical protein
VDGGAGGARSVFARANAVADSEPDTVTNSFAYPKSYPQPHTGSGYV